ncbi:PREDICTED: uncharacterized protein LOC109218601 [Nicotiana attenuata]|uniref:uncharacterized protein LOC109218601 n=1 Tax=Nicotiana attenuata TaxID=49451 RepID=UPI000904FE09|nr:PREDICTED: uncharacterized protein LOC109218601 [Nicotiana attenuata]
MTGDKLNDSASIKEEIVSFYEGLMRTVAHRLSEIDKKIMEKDPLCHNNGESYCVGMSLSKKSISVIKKKVTEVVTDFFTTWSMYKAINCTAITLVPNTHKPKTVKEFRPIACCIVLYKLISKILASRLQAIISTVISDSHSGLFQEKRIQTMSSLHMNWLKPIPGNIPLPYA